MGSTAGSIADTDRGTDEELDDFNEEEDQESFSALYRLVNEESPPPEMPQPKRKNFSCISRSKVGNFDLWQCAVKNLFGLD